MQNTNRRAQGSRSPAVGWTLRTGLLLLVLFWPGIAGAEESGQGYLYLPELADGYPEEGKHDTGFYVFAPDGRQVRSPGGAHGQWSSGQRVALEAGAWFVSIADDPRPLHLTHLRVEEGRVTVIPSGWLQIFTQPSEEQPGEGCRPWRAEIARVMEDESGRRVQIASNRAASPGDRGMLRVPAGEISIEFQRLPISLEVGESELVEIPLGFQPAPAGDAPTISAAGPEVSEVLRIPLCTSGGMLQVPAGRFWVSARVPSENSPRGERAWREVNVEPSLPPRREEVTWQAAPQPLLPPERRMARPATEEEHAAVLRAWSDTPSSILPRR